MSDRPEHVWAMAVAHYAALPDLPRSDGAPRPAWTELTVEAQAGWLAAMYAAFDALADRMRPDVSDVVARLKFVRGLAHE